MLNFENCNKAIFSGVPPYGIPQIIPENIKISELEWIPFNYANTAKDRSKKGVHFYVDDYQFSRLWNRPDDYISMLSEFAAVCTPDFSQSATIWRSFSYSPRLSVTAISSRLFCSKI